MEQQLLSLFVLGSTVEPCVASLRVDSKQVKASFSDEPSLEAIDKQDLKPDERQAGGDNRSLWRRVLPNPQSCLCHVTNAVSFAQSYPGGSASSSPPGRHFAPGSRSRLVFAFYFDPPGKSLRLRG